MAKKAKETPMMKQHQDIKSKYPDAILLFRVGDFYETFSNDAIIASKVLGITLTKRSNGAASSIELAGFPHHALDTYLHKLVKAGYRVAICDQLEDPKSVKGLVKRGVTELVTPGVAINDKILTHTANNYLASVYWDHQAFGIAFVDVSTGEFIVAEGTQDYIDKLIQSFQPSEILVSKSQVKHFKESFDVHTFLYPLEDWIMRDDYCKNLLTTHFETHSLKGFGVEDLTLSILAAGAIMHYLNDTKHDQLNHLTSIQRITSHEFLWMDRFTIRNLELLPKGQDDQSSLLQSLDLTITPMGARMLKKWMLFPLSDLEKIEQRQNIISELIKFQDDWFAIKNHLKHLGDVERLISKISLGKINPRELNQFGKSLKNIEDLKSILTQSHSPLLQTFGEQLRPHQESRAKIENSLNEDPPVNLVKGGVIKSGVHTELDELRNIAHDGKNYLLNLQQREIENTGITSLKVAYNNVFGYYLEVTNSHKNKVPESWIRKQTLTSAERYITPELKTYEEKILGAEEKILSIENQLFLQLISSLIPDLHAIQTTAHYIAQLDVLSSFSESAIKFNYRKPQIKVDADLDIKNGRHPVIEQHLADGEPYIPNDVLLNKTHQQLIILTGPNMSGKSAFLRQTALIVLMAHMGSFVPADSAVIPVTDKIFTRVGASDNLSGGESTFMVEMNETAGIINNISERSLIILDEIGRGTSTYDGISIAWSIAEHLHEHPFKPRTLFATHYHELNELEAQFDGIKNWHITYKETGNKVVFLRRMAPGGSRHSFGIQVARMAGMPPLLLKRAEEILKLLEEKNSQQPEQITNTLKNITQVKHHQLNIFDGVTEDLKAIQEILYTTDINTLTPVEALLKLNELQAIVKVYNRL